MAKIGWGVIDISNSQKLHVANGTIRTLAKDEHVLRLRQISTEINAVIKHWNPTMACVERVFFNMNAKSSLSVGEARGVILATLFAADIKVAEFSALQIKQSLTGGGRANKQQVAWMVEKILNFDSQKVSADETDALACALTAVPIMTLNNMKIGNEMPLSFRIRRTRRRRRA